MSKLVASLLVILVACSNDDPFSPTASAAETASLAVNPPSGDADIRALAAELEAAWTAKNAVRFGALYAEDVVFIQPTGVRVTGQATVQAQHAGLFAGPGANSSLVPEIQSITFLTGTIAMVDLTLSYTGYTFLAPGVRATSPGLLKSQVRWVLVKRAGEWRIVGQQNTPIPPAS